MAAASSDLDAPTAAMPVKAPDASPPTAPAKGKGKEKKEGKGKKGKKGAAEADADPGAPSIAAHPRAARSVARTKSWAGLAGFLVGGYLSLPTATPADAGLRALIAGLVCYVVAWAGAVFAWRRLVPLEVKAREQQLIEAARERAGAPARERR